MLSAIACDPDRVQMRPVAGLPPRLLSVVFQYLIAGRGQLGAILLKASQNSEIALVDHRPAEALNIARTSLLLLRRPAALLGDGAG